MTIRFHCEHCSKTVEAPDSAGGRRGKCPYCDQSNYIPGGGDTEELELAPIDEGEERLRRQEVHELMEADRDLLAETSLASADPRLSERDAAEMSPHDVYHLVVNYCLDMVDGNLERAQAHVIGLRKFDNVSLQAVDDFISGRKIEPALDTVPVKVLQGFLKNLLGDIRGD